MSDDPTIIGRIHPGGVTVGPKGLTLTIRRPSVRPPQPGTVLPLPAPVDDEPPER